MLTIRFDEEDHHRSAPYFNLPTVTTGRHVSLGDFHEKSSLVLMFLPEACQECNRFLQQLSSCSQEFARENASLLAVFPAGSPTVHEMKETVDGHMLLLEDPGLAARRAYTGLMAPGLVSETDLLCFVLDSYGAAYACLAGSQPEPADQDELLSWLRFIGIQCPE